MDALAGLSMVFLLGGVAIQFLGKSLSARVKGWLAFLSGAAAFAAILHFAPAILDGKHIEANLFPWQATSAFRLYFDGLSWVFALMATGIGSAILFYCIDYMQHETSTTRFYALMLTFIAGLVGLVSSQNLLMAYFCWEVIGLCSYFLVGFWYRQTAAVNGARKVLVMTHIPGYALLIAILLLFQSSGTFLWTDPAVAAAFHSGIFFLILIAAMAKSVIFPLNTWIPEAMNAPTPVSALLHSACYVKAGVYLVARVYSIIPWQPAWNTVLLVVGCLTMLMGALFALLQTDLKRMLAYSTISQLGYIMTAFGLGTPLGILAGLFYVFSHGLFKGTLFLCAGAIQHAAGTRDLRELGGLAKKMPGTAVIWLVATAAIIGVPLTNGFVAKWLLYDAALESDAWMVILIAWLVSSFTAFYMLKATIGVFLGEPSPALHLDKVEDASPRMLAGMGVLAAVSLLFGIVPQALVKWIANPAAAALNFPTQNRISFLGLQATSQGAPITAGALLAISALLIIALLFVLRRPAQSSSPVFTGGDPLPDGNGLTPVDFSEFAESTFAPAGRWLNPDPAYFFIWKMVFNTARLARKGMEQLEKQPLLLSIGAAMLISALVLWL